MSTTTPHPTELVDYIHSVLATLQVWEEEDEK